MKLAMPWWAYDVTERHDGAEIAIRFRVRRVYLAWLWLRTVCTLIVSILLQKVRA